MTQIFSPNFFCLCETTISNLVQLLLNLKLLKHTTMNKFSNLRWYDISARILTISSILVTFILVSCSENDLSDIDSVNSSEIEKPDYKVNNLGFLEFRDRPTFDSVMHELIEMDENQFLSWERSIGFTSMSTTFENIVDVETAFLENLEANYTGDTTFSDYEIKHSPLAYEYEDMLIFSEEGFFEPDINTPAHALVTNRDGIVKIGNVIYNFSRNSVKTIIDGDAQKIPLLKQTDATNESRAITVNNIERRAIEVSGSTNSRNIVSSCAWDCRKTEGSYRLYAFAYLNRYQDGSSYTWDYYLELWSQRRILGQWNWNRTNDMSTTGSVVLLQGANIIVNDRNYFYDFNYGRIESKFWLNNHQYNGDDIYAYNNGDDRWNPSYYGAIHIAYGRNGTTCQTVFPTHWAASIDCDLVR